MTKKKTKFIPEVEEESIVEVVVELEEPAAEEPVAEADPDTEDNNTHEHTDKIGYVVNCDRLNVRGNANASAEVVSVLNVGDKVIINLKKSTTKFYNVTTSAGVEGFCMVAYISE